MEFRHLRYFIAVAEEQNITRAAAQLRVSQPSLSRQIRDLEADLGVGLLEHGGRSIRLTEAGRALLEEARAIMSRVEEAVCRVKAIAVGLAGDIQLGFSPSLGVDLLPCLLRDFQKAHPEINVHLHDLSTMQMLRGLRDGSLHLALMVCVNPGGMADLEFLELEKQPVCVALPHGHPLADGAAPDVSQLANERLVALTLAEYPEYHEWIAGLFADGPQFPRISAECDSASSLLTAVEVGRGVALVSQRTEALAGTRLAIRPLEPAPPPLRIGLVSARGRRPPLADLLLKHARVHGADQK